MNQAASGIATYKIVRPDVLLRRRMTALGFRFGQAYAHSKDLAEYCMMVLPKGWIIMRDMKVSAIFDETSEIRFVEMIGDIDHESRFVEVHSAKELHRRMMLSFLSFAKIEPNLSYPEGFALLVWMAQAKPATLRVILKEDNERFDSQHARVWVQPPLPKLTEFSVRRVEVATSENARSARSSQQ